MARDYTSKTGGGFLALLTSLAPLANTAYEVYAKHKQAQVDADQSKKINEQGEALLELQKIIKDLMKKFNTKDEAKPANEIQHPEDEYDEPLVNVNSNAVNDSYNPVPKENQAQELHDGHVNAFENQAQELHDGHVNAFENQAQELHDGHVNAFADNTKKDIPAYNPNPLDKQTAFLVDKYGVPEKQDIVTNITKDIPAYDPNPLDQETAYLVDKYGVPEKQHSAFTEEKSAIEGSLVDREEASKAMGAHKERDAIEGAFHEIHNIAASTAPAQKKIGQVSNNEQGIAVANTGLVDSQTDMITKLIALGLAVEETLARVKNSPAITPIQVMDSLMKAFSQSASVNQTGDAKNEANYSVNISHGIKMLPST